MDVIERAWMVAEKAHESQMYDIYPYTYHLHQVYNIAKDLGFDRAIQTACILHDIIEDTTISYNDVKDNFGEEIAEIVYCVTDELGRNRKERKQKTYPKIHSNWKAIIVKVCDRIANVKQSKQFSPERFKMYVKENEDFERNLRNNPVKHIEEKIVWEALDDVLK